MNNDKRPINIILLGDIASGKATQAELIAKRYHLYDFDMGHEVRQPAARRLYDYAHTTATGKLTPTRIVRKITKERIASMPKSTGILFDGHPKMIGEAKLVTRLLRKHGRRDPIFIYLKLPMQESMRRSTTRVVRIGRKMARRQDDAPQALKNRIRYYRTQIVKVRAFFEKQYVHKAISGLGTRKEVFKRLVEYIDSER